MLYRWKPLFKPPGPTMSHTRNHSLFCITWQSEQIIKENLYLKEVYFQFQQYLQTTRWYINLLVNLGFQTILKIYIYPACLWHYIYSNILIDIISILSIHEISDKMDTLILIVDLFYHEINNYILFMSCHFAIAPEVCFAKFITTISFTALIHWKAFNLTFFPCRLCWR